VSTRRLVPASSASPAPPISFAAKSDMVNVSNRGMSRLPSSTVLLWSLTEVYAIRHCKCLRDVILRWFIFLLGTTLPRKATQLHFWTTCRFLLYIRFQASKKRWQQSSAGVNSLLKGIISLIYIQLLRTRLASIALQVSRISVSSIQANVKQFENDLG
jgi:hypothetical protein